MLYVVTKCKNYGFLRFIFIEFFKKLSTCYSFPREIGNTHLFSSFLSVIRIGRSLVVPLGHYSASLRELIHISRRSRNAVELATSQLSRFHFHVELHSKMLPTSSTRP